MWEMSEQDQKLQWSFGFSKWWYSLCTGERNKVVCPTRDRWPILILSFSRSLSWTSISCKLFTWSPSHKELTSVRIDSIGHCQLHFGHSVSHSIEHKVLIVIDFRLNIKSGEITFELIWCSVREHNNKHIHIHRHTHTHMISSCMRIYPALQMCQFVRICHILKTTLSTILSACSSPERIVWQM